MQQDVDTWAQKHGDGYWKPLEILARLMEETGELAREVNHQYGPKKRKGSEREKEISDELGDILFTISCLANSLDIDLGDSFARVMDKCYTRDKDRYSNKD